MSSRTARRSLTGLTTAILLSTALAGCAGQSVAEACAIAQSEGAAASTAFQQRFGEITKSLQAGGDVNSLLDQAKGAFAELPGAVSNDEVKTALQGLSDAYDGYIEGLKQGISGGDVAGAVQNQSGLEAAGEQLSSICAPAAAD